MSYKLDNVVLNETGTTNYPSGPPALAIVFIQLCVVSFWLSIFCSGVCPLFLFYWLWSCSLDVLYRNKFLLPFGLLIVLQYKT